MLRIPSFRESQMPDFVKKRAQYSASILPQDCAKNNCFSLKYIIKYRISGQKYEICGQKYARHPGQSKRLHFVFDFWKNCAIIIIRFAGCRRLRENGKHAAFAANKRKDEKHVL